MENSRSRALWILTASVLSSLSLVLLGCGGSLPSGSGVGAVHAIGCGGVLKNPTLTVQYPDRSLPSAVGHPLSSALSGSVRIKNANPGGGDIVFTFNRDPGKVGAHSETYNLPNISTGTFSGSATFYSLANQAGVIVGSLTAQDVVDCAGQTFSSVSLGTAIKSVVVAPLTVTVGGPNGQLIFTAKDAANNPVAVTPGSAIFKSVGVAATVTPDGVVSPVSVGTVQVTASVDGFTSPSATVTVNSLASIPTYHLTEIKPNTAINNSIQIGHMNENGYVVCTEKDGGVTYMGFCWNKALGTNYIGSYAISIDEVNGVLAQNVDAYGNIQATYYYGNAGTAGGIKYDDGGKGWAPWFVFGNGSAVGGNVYWASTSAAPVTMTGPVGTTQFIPAAANASGMVVGSGNDSLTQYGIYWPTPTSPGVKVLGTMGFPSAVSSDGRMVGSKGGAQDMYYWPSGGATPTMISISGTTLIPNGVNNKGMFCGYAEAGINAYPFVGNIASGPVDLSTRLDAASSGWTLYRAWGINDSGWVVGDGLDPSGRPAGFVAIPL